MEVTSAHEPLRLFARVRMDWSHMQMVLDLKAISMLEEDLSQVRGFPPALLHTPACRTPTNCLEISLPSCRVHLIQILTQCMESGDSLPDETGTCSLSVARWLCTLAFTHHPPGSSSQP